VLAVAVDAIFVQLLIGPSREKILIAVSSSRQLEDVREFS
jgi:hypothetical protein